MFNSFWVFPQKVYNKNVLVKLLSAKHTVLLLMEPSVMVFHEAWMIEMLYLTIVIITISVNSEYFIRANIIEHCSAT